MALRSALQQASFTGGEVSPSLYGRVDLSRYTTSLRTCLNWFVKPEGGVSKRSGTRFICEVKNHAAETRIVPFQFSTTATYVLEFGDQYMRVIKDGGQVLESAKNITGITQANPAVVTSASHGYSNGDHVFIQGVSGMAQVNQRTFVVRNKTANTYELETVAGGAVDSTGYDAYTSGGTCSKVYEIATPYSAAAAGEMKYAQSADVLYIAHPSYAPRKLSRTGDAAWTLEVMDFGTDLVPPSGFTGSWSSTYPDGSTSEKYIITSFDSATGEESIASDPPIIVARNKVWTAGVTIGLSWSAAIGATDYNIYKAQSGVFGYVGTASTTSFSDNNIVPDTTDTAPEAFNPFADDNHPSTVTFFEDRLYWAASNTLPQTAWGSQPGNYTNHDRSSPPNDGDGVEFTINARQVNKIEHMVPLDDLILLTSGAVWAASGQGENEPLTPNSIRVRVQSYSGAESVEPVLISDTVLYVEDKAQSVRDLYYQFASDAYTGSDLTIMSRHLFTGKTIVDWAFSKVPHSIVWACRSDGALLGLTYVREHEVWGWHRHDTAASGKFEHVAVVSEGDEDAVYFVVKRTIGGETHRFIERLQSRVFSDQTDAYFVDCGLKYDGAETSSLTGLWHLEGEDVAILADAEVEPAQTVTNGTVTLQNPATKASVGLPYTADVETLDLNAPIEGGALASKNRKVSKIHLRINEARGLFAAETGSGVLNELKQRTTEAYGDPIALQSGIVEIVVNSTWGKRGRAFIRSSDPLPAEIQSIIPEFAVGG